MTRTVRRWMSRINGQWTAVCISALLCAACGSTPSWHLTDISGHLPDLRFSGTSDGGAPIDADTLKGKVVLLYFGFSHCTEDCPIVMARLAEVLRGLGPDAGQVRVLFVSLDPSHDQAPVLQRYLGVFDTGHSVGLTASEAATEAMAKRYRIAFYPSDNRPLAADIPHSDAVYAFDRRGHARLLITPNNSTRAIETDLHRLLAEGAS